MLVMAKGYEREIKNKFYKSYLNPKYKYYFLGGYFTVPSFEEDDWNYIKVASVVNDEVIGLFTASVDRVQNCIKELGIINFSNDPFVFSRDLSKFIEMLFDFYGFYKIKFSSVSENPANKMYEKFINRYDGRIIGTSVADCRLRDGRYYSVVYYELFRNKTIGRGLK